MCGDGSAMKDDVSDRWKERCESVIHCVPKRSNAEDIIVLLSKSYMHYELFRDNPE